MPAKHRVQATPLEGPWVPNTQVQELKVVAPEMMVAELAGHANDPATLHVEQAALEHWGAVHC